VSVPLSESYARQLAAEEASPVPFFIRFVRLAVWLLYTIVLVTVVILMIAFVLQLFDASTSAEFTRWIYRSADSAMGPFRGIFPATEIGEGSVLNTSLLFAAAMYVIVAIVLDLMLRALTAKVSARQRRVVELRDAARDAAAREYEYAQQVAIQQRYASGSDLTPSPGVPVASAPSAPTTGLGPATDPWSTAPGGRPPASPGTQSPGDPPPPPGGLRR
jgi:uncharacterized protein YggT (Ycf19 family)